MSISTDHAQLQRQLYLLGYSQALPADGAQLVSTLLKDLQAALDGVKELEAQSLQLTRDERGARLGQQRAKAEAHTLRTENNRLRAQVLGHAREAESLRREARASQYRQAKAADDLRMANLQLLAERAELTRTLGDAQRRCEARLSDLDPRGRIRHTASAPPPPPPATAMPPRVAPAIVDLVDLSARRIAALELEISDLEDKLAAGAAELNAARADVRERDLELARVGAEYERLGAPRNDGDDDSARLADQVDVLHERAEALEREAREQREQFAREKDEMRKRWVAAENDRQRATDPAPRAPSPQMQGSPGSPHTPATDDVDRLRTECANIKSLYAQTRDQLQDILRSGNAESREAVEKARQAEAASHAAVRDLQKQLQAASELRELADARANDIARLEDRLRTADADHRAELANHQAEVARLGDQLAHASNAQQRATAAEAGHRTQHDALKAEFRQLVEQHAKLDKSLKHAVAEVGEWRAKADEREHRTAELARRADEYKLLYRQNASELTACKKTLDAFTQDLDSLREAHANHQREVARLGGELEQALRMRQAVEMSKDEYKAGLTKALAENETHRSLVAHLQAERSALRVQVKAQFHLSQRLEQRLEALDPSHSADVTLAHPLPLSRSSSAAHSSRSFSAAN